MSSVVCPIVSPSDVTGCTQMVLVKISGSKKYKAKGNNVTVGKGSLGRKKGWRCERSQERFVCGCVREQLNALGTCVKLLDRSTQNYLMKIEDNRSVYESRRESQKKPTSFVFYL